MPYWTRGTVTRQAHVGVPAGTHEDEHGRAGFAGPVSHLYRRHAPTDYRRVAGDGGPRDIAVDRVDAADAADPRAQPTPLLTSADVTIAISRRRRATPFFARNADADELHFVHRGRGRLETEYGPLDYGPGDYLLVPRGTTHRFVPAGDSDPLTLVLESRHRLELPDWGLLGNHYVFDPGLVDAPEPEAHDEAGEWEVRVKRAGELTSIFYGFHPCDVVGWKGRVAPLKLPFDAVRGVGSHRIHLPPTVHATFQGEGVLVMSMGSRPFEREPGAHQGAPYHRNVDYDEVNFCHLFEGVSGSGWRTGHVRFFPQGFHHGTEIRPEQVTPPVQSRIVMIDVARPLALAPAGLAASTTEFPP
jgi:homogentisate 1,2-dioxygenase